MDISKNDFVIRKIDVSRYEVVYTSPATKKTWTRVIGNSRLISLVSDVEKPKRWHLNDLRRTCKF